MERFTISSDEKLASEFDRLIRKRGYLNRSEAVRDMLRGKTEVVRRFADIPIAERGRAARAGQPRSVRYGCRTRACSQPYEDLMGTR